MRPVREFDYSRLRNLTDTVMHHTAADLIVEHIGEERAFLEERGATTPREAGVIATMRVYKERALVAGAVPLAIFERAKTKLKRA